MGRRFVMGLSGLLLLAAPGIALAGAGAVAGNESLTLSVKVKPNKAKAKGVALHLSVDYQSTNKNQRITAFTKEIDLSLPPGMTITPANAAVCSADAIVANKNDPSICPSASVVGGGTVTADARPLIATPVVGQATLYNTHGHHPDVYLWVTTKYGNTGVFFVIHKSGSRESLVATYGQPKPGAKSVDTLKTVDVAIHNSSTGKPYVSAPSSCAGKWPFKISISTFSSNPTVTARASAACTR